MRRFLPALATLPLALWACDKGPGSSGPPVVVPRARLELASARENGRRRNLSSRPRDFTDPSWRGRSSPAEIYLVIRNGRRGTAMAGWKILDEEQTWDLVAYVLSVAKSSD